MATGAARQQRIEELLEQVGLRPEILEKLHDVVDIVVKAERSVAGRNFSSVVPVGF